MRITLNILNNWRRWQRNWNPWEMIQLLNSKAQQMRKLATCINKAIIEKDLKVGEDGTITTTEFIDLDI